MPRGYFKRDAELLGRLISVAAASLRIRRLTVEELYGSYDMRSQLHLFISAPWGMFKSTLLEEIGRSFPAVKATHLTFPGLIGSIDRSTRQIIPALAWESRNKLLLLDEYTQTRASQTTQALLQLMEDGYYSRKVAVWSADTLEEDGDLYFRVRDGHVEVKTRFSCIIATMKNIRKAREPTFKALLSRCIPFVYDMSLDEIDEVLDGKPILDREEYEPSSEVVINRGDYSQIKSIVRGVVETSGGGRGRQVYARAVGDCCRIFAVLGRHDERLYRRVTELKLRLT